MYLIGGTLVLGEASNWGAHTALPDRVGPGPASGGKAVPGPARIPVCVHSRQQNRAYKCASRCPSARIIERDQGSPAVRSACSHCASDTALLIFSLSLSLALPRSCHPRPQNLPHLFRISLAFSFTFRCASFPKRCNGVFFVSCEKSRDRCGRGDRRHELHCRGCIACSGSGSGSERCVVAGAGHCGACSCFPGRVCGWQDDVRWRWRMLLVEWRECCLEG